VKQMLCSHIVELWVDTTQVRCYDDCTMSDKSVGTALIGIGTTFDYSLLFAPMCRMIAEAGFRAITVGGGNIAHSGYDTEEGRLQMLDATRAHNLRIDSVHAPFGAEADLSEGDVRTEIPKQTAEKAGNAERNDDVRMTSDDCGTARGEVEEPGVDIQPLANDDAARNLEGRHTGLPQPATLRPLQPSPKFSYKPAEQRLQAIARVKMAIDAASALGSGIVVVHPGDRFAAEETRARISAARDSFKQLMKYAAERNVRLAVENLASPLSMQVFEAVLEQLPELGVCYDTSHAQVAGDTFGVMGRYQDRIIAVHLSDNRGLKDDHLLPFEGMLPWEEFAYYFPRMKNLGCFMLEVEIRESAFKDRGEFLAEAYRRAKQVLEMASAGRR